MTNARYSALMSDDSLSLTPDEIEEGWHFCADWDSLLVGPGMVELLHCQCTLIP